MNGDANADPVFTRDSRDPVLRLQTVYRLFGRLVADVDRRLTASGNSTERRILIELGFRPGASNATLSRVLGIDPSHLSRTIKRLIETGEVGSGPSPRHNSQRSLRLTASGTKRARALEADWAKAILDQRDTLANDELGLVTSAASASILDLQDSAGGLDVELRDLEPKDFGWVLEQARARGRAYQAWTTRRLADHLAKGYPQLGAVALHFGAIVGACFLVPHERDDTICEVAGFYFYAMGGDVTARPMLRRCVEAARELTMARVTAPVLTSDRDLARLLREVGFKKHGETYESARYGLPDMFYQYDLTFPPYDASASG